MKLAKISTKIPEKWDKNKNNGFGLGPQFLIIKLANFERKSMKNQWKINENWMKFQIKLTIISPISEPNW